MMVPTGLRSLITLTLGITELAAWCCSCLVTCWTARAAFAFHAGRYQKILSVSRRVLIGYHKYINRVFCNFSCFRGCSMSHLLSTQRKYIIWNCEWNCTSVQTFRLWTRRNTDDIKGCIIATAKLMIPEVTTQPL
jgi:hypothetical protein